MDSSAVLDVRDLTVAVRKSDAEHEVVRGVSFAVGRGEVVGLVGESGCGKSITSLAMMGLLPRGVARVTAGSALLNGFDLIAASDEEVRERRGTELSMIFQEPMTSLNPVFTVGNQLRESIRAHQRVSRREADDRCAQMLKEVGFADPRQALRKYPHELSGGLRQRVMIAMALLGRPALLIADEPTTALDVTIQAQVLQIMRDVCSDLGTAIVLISHDLGVMAEMADRVIVMYAGQVFESASAELLYANHRHPYTEGLLESIPRVDTQVSRLKVIPGRIGALGTQISGCAFGPRCRYAVEDCRRAVPLLDEIEPGHLVRCLRAEEFGR